MSLRYVYHKLKCPVCNRKILVERHLVGVSHSVSVSVICAECITPPSAVTDFDLKMYEDISNWIKE